MITNERQLKIAKGQLARLKQAVTELEYPAADAAAKLDVLAKAELDALKSEVSSLSDQVSEYEALRLGRTAITATSLDDLPRVLIQARIAQNLTQGDLADLIGVHEQQIQRYESSEYRSASLDRLREIADALDLRIPEAAEFEHGIPASKEALDLDWTQFPVREMYRRQWFEGFSGSLREAVSEAEALVKGFLGDVIRRPSTALYRQQVRADSTVDPYALMAWECRVLRLGQRAELGGAYRREALDANWISELVEQSRLDDGPIRAQRMLAEVGIALVIEAHLAGTHLDGAALLHGATPVIGMTLRYDRIDNFWFVLLHELFHVIKHLRKRDVRRIFDDLDAVAEEEIEREADAATEEALIQSSVWEMALARYVRSANAINELARNLGISPAIVAGRIRHESGNYTILSDLVGSGEVRKHFPMAGFGA